MRYARGPIGRGNARGPIGLLAVLGVTAGALAGCGSTPAQGAPATTAGASVTATGAASPTGSPSTTAPATTATTAAATTAATTAVTTTETPATTATSPSGASPTSGTAAPSGTAVTKLTRGSSGPQVRAVQQRLSELGYWVGTADGRYGEATAQAVIALQKAAGLSRDGVLGAKTRAALDRGVRPSARSTSGHVLEVDKKRQLLLVVDGGRVSLVVSVSTGSGEFYARPGGGTGHAVTPVGRYRVGRTVDGWDDGPLGSLYRPRYFNGGIAVHGYPSVPAYPASHGCVRVSLPAMDMIWKDGIMPKGTTVWVY